MGKSDRSNQVKLNSENIDDPIRETSPKENNSVEDSSSVDDIIYSPVKVNSIGAIIKFFKMRLNKMFNNVTAILVLLLIVETFVGIMFIGVHNNFKNSVSHLYRVPPVISQVMKIEHSACNKVDTKEQKLICSKIKDITRDTIIMDTEALSQLGIEFVGGVK